MNSEVRALFKVALVKSLDVIRPLITKYTEPYLGWISKGDGWTGVDVNQPDWTIISLVTEKAIEDINSDFINMFRKEYPEHAGLVGSPSLGAANITVNSSLIVRGAIRELWERHGTLDLGEADIDAITQEFEDFVDSSTVKVRFMAVLANFTMDGRLVELPRNMVIRRMSEKEINRIHGGSYRERGYLPSRAWTMDAYVVEGRLEEKKLVGEWRPSDSPPTRQYSIDLDRVILALRTFKEGMVGYDLVRFYDDKFIPVNLPIYGKITSTPLGNYQLSGGEIEPLERHAREIFATTEPAMELACSRLADAETRLSPRDRLLDAVIGLEALLLAGIGKEDRKSELGLRFSLHYSTFFSRPEERFEAYRVAKDLYKLRSIIAHGGTLHENECRVGSEKISLDQAAKMTCKILRELIHFFLPQSGKTTYKNPEYWQRRCFGLEVS